jgi:uncharacterized protein YqiB (DUF1249 family)
MLEKKLFDLHNCVAAMLADNAELARLLAVQNEELASLRQQLESVEKRLHDIESKPPVGIWPAVGAFD